MLQAQHGGERVDNNLQHTCKRLAAAWASAAPGAACVSLQPGTAQRTDNFSYVVGLVIRQRGSQAAELQQLPPVHPA